MASSSNKILILLACAFFAACGEQAEIVDLGLVGEAQGPAEPAPLKSTPHEPRQVVVPETLKGRYSHATLAIKLPDMAEAAEVELPLNGQPQQTEYGTLSVRDYLPAFRMQDNTITSAGVEEKNPALWAEWQRDGKPVFSGWLFRNYPNMSPVHLAKHQIGLVGAR